MNQSASKPILDNSFVWPPTNCPRIETEHRRIVTALPVPETANRLTTAARLFPTVNCYQPPVIWDRADGYQVSDTAGNRWIDFSSCAVMANSGHGDERVRRALQRHVASGPLAQFSFASDVRVQLAERLLNLPPACFDKVYFWTVGSEAIECALRLCRTWGMKKNAEKWRILSHAGAFHGWTLGAHQLSGDAAQKSWLPCPDAGMHRLRFPRVLASDTDDRGIDWAAFFDSDINALRQSGVRPEHVAAVFVETVRGLEALPLPTAYLQRLREWADEHDVLLVFDEMQTAFGRTGRWFGFSHYPIRPDLICVGKGITSSLPLAAVLGPADVLDVLPPAAITTTHAAHPLSCTAALANLDVLEQDGLLDEAARKGELTRDKLRHIQSRYPDRIAAITGWGLMNAIHVRHNVTGEPDRELTRDWTWEAVKRGVMLFFTNHSTIKVCPPLMIPDAALLEGIDVLEDALQSATAVCR